MSCRRRSILHAFLWLLLVVVVVVGESQSGISGQILLPFTEDSRLLEYQKRNYTWPIPNNKFRPNTTGWTQLMKERLSQIQEIIPNDQVRVCVCVLSCFHSSINYSLYSCSYLYTKQKSEIYGLFANHD